MNQHRKEMSVTDHVHDGVHRLRRWGKVRLLTHRSLPICGVQHPDYCDSVYCTRGPDHDGVHMVIRDGQPMSWRTATVGGGVSD